MAENQSPKLIQSGPEWQEAGLAHRYLSPDGPGPHPTAVLIHGRLGDEDVMWLFQRAIPASWLIVAPRAPLADADGFSWHILEGDEWPVASDFDAGVDALIHFLRALPNLYNADPDRLYLIGFSQGAAVAYAAALHEPALVQGIAGLVGFAPGAPAEEIAGRLNNLPVFMAVGVNDPTIPYQKAQESADFLRRAGANLEYHEYETGHKLTSAGLKDLGRWLLARP